MKPKIFDTKMRKYGIFVAKICKYGIFVAKICKYALNDSFQRHAAVPNRSTNCAALSRNNFFLSQSLSKDSYSQAGLIRMAPAFKCIQRPLPSQP